MQGGIGIVTRTAFSDSNTIRAQIAEREKKIADLVTRAAGGKKNSVRSQVRDLRRFVEGRMGDIRKLLSEHASPIAVRMALAKHVDEIRLLPDDDGKEIKYWGSWKLLGSTDGAEGQS
ncbi:MAG TPA: hypothetical protein VMD78_00560 [Candidatus Baltobacteraceae bacterium]|nr:hypothetical protein [Candidatus Baltobacteraceae bacterium]